MRLSSTVLPMENLWIYHCWLKVYFSTSICIILICWYLLRLSAACQLCFILHYLLLLSQQIYFYFRFYYASSLIQPFNLKKVSFVLAETFIENWCVYRVETKIFVFVFSRKFRKTYFSAFREKSLRKFLFSRKVSQKFSVSRKFSIRNADPDPGAT
jgi:hypothetical protein